MKVAAMSDLHGYLPTPEAVGVVDIVLIAGDISPLDIQRDHLQMYDWVFETLLPWIKSLQCVKVFLTPGNHDFFFERRMISKSGRILNLKPALELASNSKLKILMDESTTFYNKEDLGNDLVIYGTPRCKQFGNWAFMHDEVKLEDYYEMIPDNVDILLTHQPPAGQHGIGAYKIPVTKHDALSHEFMDYDYIQAGSFALQDVIDKKKPTYCVSGHIHNGRKGLIKYGETTYVNCALLNDDYVPHYPITYFEI